MFLLYVGISIINFTYFDRYIVPLLLITFMIIVPRVLTKLYPSKWITYIFVAFLSLRLIFSILANRFYLEWSRVKWSAARELIDQGISPQKIDGGHEFNFWHGAEFNRFGKWNPENYDYVIFFSELEGFSIQETYPLSGSLSGPVLSGSKIDGGVIDA